MNCEPRSLPLIAAVCLALAGCGTQEVSQQAATGLRAKIGYGCKIQFRRDALGAAVNPVPPTSDSFNGSDVSISGKLKDVKGDWLVIERPTGTPNQTFECWVPTHSVLLLEWSREPLK